MLNRFFSRVYEFSGSHTRAVLAVVAIVTAAALGGLFFVRFEGKIDLMLPPDRDITRSMQFLRESSLSDKIIVSLSLTRPDRDKKDLFAATDRLAASLRPPMFVKVMSGVSLVDAMEEFSVLHYAPQILGEAELALLDKQISGPAVDSKLKQVYLQSFRPESIFTSSFSRTDPLGIKGLLYGKLKALPSSMGYTVQVEDGHFVSQDGRHAMVIIQTSVAMTDSRGSKALLAALRESIGQLPDFVSADIIAGHLHTVSNEKVITRDITTASVIASIAFMTLFLAVFRDLRAFLIYVIPLIAVAWSIMLSSAVLGTLSYLVIGFGTALAGISIDFGLTVYIAIKRGAALNQKVQLGRLILINGVTTIFSFLVLFFSSISGYHQLALFSILCIFFCMIFSVVVLPLLLPPKKPAEARPALGERLEQVRWPAKTIIAVWAVLTVVFIALSFTVRFENDVKKLDGTEPEILKAEQNFHRIWGGAANQAIFVVEGRTTEEAMERNDRIYRDAAAAIGPENFTNIALFWPSERTRAANVERWDRFWRSDRERKLRALVARSAARYGFTDKAFAPFFDGLYRHEVKGASTAGMIAHLQERFIMNGKDGSKVASFFPDEPRYVEAIDRIAGAHPGSYIVSGRKVSNSISVFTAREARFLAPLAVLFNVVLVWMFFRNWSEAFISLVPVITCVTWLIGIMAVFNMPLNVLSVLAAIVMTGVIVDYGISITYDHRYNLKIGTVVAVTLSALTSIIGGGAMLFAKHPAFRSTSIAMTICLVAGYLSAVIVVPAFCSLLPRRPEQAG